MPLTSFGGFGNKVFGKLHVGRRRFLVRNLREQIGPCLCADAHDEMVTPLVENFGERQVETRTGFGACVHGRAEARATRLDTIHRDDEYIFAMQFIDSIDVGTLQKYFVLDAQGVQFTRAHADEGELGGLARLRHDLEKPVRAVGLPQAHGRRENKFLPGMCSADESK